MVARMFKRSLLSAAILLQLHGCASAAPCPESTLPEPSPTPRERAILEFDGMRLSVVGLGVVSAPHVAGGEELGVLGVPANTTTVHLLLVDPETRLLASAPAQTRLALEDEHGEPIRSRETSSLFDTFRPGPGPIPTVSADRSTMLLQLVWPGTPPPGTRALRLRGQLAVVTGSARAAASDQVTLEPGETLQLGDAVLRVRRVEPLADEPTRLRVIFEAVSGLGSVDALDDVTARADGQPLGIAQWGRSVTRIGNDERAEVEYVLDRADVTELEIGATYVADPRTVAIPVDLTFGVGR